MGFFSNLFKKGEDPDAHCSDEVLGALEWSEDDEAWLGEFKGIKFALAYDRSKQPTEVVVAYAREVLQDPSGLTTSLAEAKVRTKEKYEKFYHAEIDALSFEQIDFYLYKGKRRIIASLAGGLDYRAWRIEYSDRKCEGIGFDS